MFGLLFGHFRNPLSQYVWLASVGGRPLQTSLDERLGLLKCFLGTSTPCACKCPFIPAPGETAASKCRNFPGGLRHVSVRKTCIFTIIGPIASAPATHRLVDHGHPAGCGDGRRALQGQGLRRAVRAAGPGRSSDTLAHHQEALLFPSAQRKKWAVPSHHPGQGCSPHAINVPTILALACLLQLPQWLLEFPQSHSCLHVVGCSVFLGETRAQSFLLPHDMDGPSIAHLCKVPFELLTSL